MNSFWSLNIYCVLIYFLLSRVQTVAKWLKRWTADQEVQVLAPLATGIFSCGYT